MGVVSTASARIALDQLDWTAFRDQRLGFAFTYPGKLFVPQAGADPTAALKEHITVRSGQIFRTADGKAYLQAVAFANVDRVDIAAYMARVKAAYGARFIEYQRLTPDFFVVSGERDRETFYERVYFTCGGRLVTAWAMVYPAAEGALYDRIVEAIARSFRPAESSQACGAG